MRRQPKPFNWEAKGAEMTGWHLTIGYNPSGGEADCFEQLCVAARAVERKPDLVAFEAGVEGEDALAYFHPVNSKAVTVLRDKPDDAGDEWEPSIMLSASGGGRERRVKERLARAFVLMVLRRMADREINVSVSVA